MRILTIQRKISLAGASRTVLFGMHNDPRRNSFLLQGVDCTACSLSYFCSEASVLAYFGESVLFPDLCTTRLETIMEEFEKTVPPFELHPSMDDEPGYRQVLFLGWEGAKVRGRYCFQAPGHWDLGKCGHISKHRELAMRDYIVVPN